MSGIIGSRLNNRGSGLVGSLGTDGQALVSSGAGNGAVFETVASDLTPVRQDILTLALKQAVEENHTKYNLPNSSICKFEADADLNLAGSTDIGRNASEYLYCQVTGATRTVSGNETAIIDGDYTIYKWINTAGGSIVIANASLTCDYLVVGGGGGAGGAGNANTRGGGGGGGGFHYNTSYSLAVGTHAITIGAGGTGAANYSQLNITAGGSSIFGSVQTAGGGGHGGSYDTVNNGAPSDATDGSGGGAGVASASNDGIGGTSGATGNDGGDGMSYTWNTTCSGGGGGGAGGEGADASGGTAGAGGAGTANSITGSSVTYASGGGAGGATGSAGGTNAGSGGSGEGAGTAATDGYGGGGGGASANTGTHAGGDGGNGTVIIRSLTTLAGSTTATALGTTNVPTSAVTDVSGVMLLKDAYGTTTLGTDVKAYFTADNSNWTEATSYADAGTFSTGIKMIKLGKATCTEGSDVRWKIAFANQVSTSKEAYIYGIGLNY